MLELCSISKHFSGLKAVDMVNMKVDDDEIVGMIGPNGSGKTTILKLITGIYPLDNGKILFRNSRLDVLTSCEIVRMGIAKTFQNPRLFESLTVIENVKVSLRILFKKTGVFNFFRQAILDRSVYNDEAHMVLEEVGLIDKMNTQIKDLPYGHRKLLELARALAGKPELLLLDEPTAGLNTDEKYLFSRRISKIKENRKITVIVVEHDIDFIRNLCTRAVVLNNGRIICNDTIQNVVKNRDVISAYFGDKIQNA